MKRWDDQIVTFNCWRAESFGVILPNLTQVEEFVQGTGSAPVMPVVYGERVVPGSAPPWRVSAEPRTPPLRPMRFWSAPLGAPNALETSPMVVALRAPLDTAVSGDNMHLQLLRDFWEIAHATSVFDVIDRTNGGTYPVNLCFVDRAGTVFSTQNGAIPQRGDDALLAAAGYHTLDKYLIYAKTGPLPVPARHSDDRMFDWRFGNYNDPVRPTPLLTLPYSLTSVPNGPFKAASLQIQSINSASPPPANAASGAFWIESGFFATVCNDQTWGFSRKRDTPSIVGTSFANVVAPRNQLFQWVLDRGVVYQSGGLAFEAPDRQQIVVDRFTRQAERIIRGGAAGLPALTPAEMREFVVSPESYRDSAYSAPNNVTVDGTLPPPIRQLKEFADNRSHPWSPEPMAIRELKFFDQLWSTLFSPTWATHQVAGHATPLQLSLQDVWVNGISPAPYQNKIFWYATPTQANPTLQWIDMPADFPLIDFYWRETEVSSQMTMGMLPQVAPLTDARFNSAITDLMTWDPAGAHYRNVPTSHGACLLEMMRMGYSAAGADHGRHWVRVKRGQVEHSGTGWVALSTSGVPQGAGALERQNKKWELLGRLAFSGEQLGTLFRDPAHNALFEAAEAALFVSPGVVRTSLTPAHINAIVEFLLSLGGHYIDPQVNGGNPSKKLARFQLAGSESEFLESLPDTYPLSDGLLRMTVPRRLQDAKVFLQSISTTPPPFSFCFRDRAYDHLGQRWPPVSQALDAPCVGSALRSIFWFPDQHPSAALVVGRGFQQKFLPLGGSIATLLAMFPSNGTDVHSYYWCRPGIEVMVSDRSAPLPSADSRFDAHMNAFATNILLETRYDSFLSHTTWSVVHAY